MRARILLLVLAILLVAGFAAQNWAEINRTSSLNFGVMTADAPMGLILLTLLGLVTLLLIGTAASLRTRHLIETRHHARALNAQRDLAEKAEASRFTDLRQVLDNHLREVRQRETVANTELDRTMAQHQRELRNQLEQMYHLLVSRMTELERRLDGRPATVRADTVPPRMADPRTVQDVPPGRERV